MKPSRRREYASPARREREQRAYARGVGSVGLTVDASELSVIADRLAMVPPEMNDELRPALAAVGAKVKGAAAAGASWSTRIPAALRVRVRFGTRNPGVFVYADAARAPHARPYEGMSGRNPFRHPVFARGHDYHWVEGGATWVDQAARPFLAPALKANESVVKAAMQEAVSEAFRKAGVTN